jgi:hypothetical protein
MSEPVSNLEIRLKNAGKELVATIRKRLYAAALMAEAEGKRNATTTIHARTGRLRASIAGRLERGPADALDLKLRAGGGNNGPDVPYAAIHEYGGIIRPVRRKWLAIPLPIARTAAGVSRYQTPRDVPGLRFMLSRRGNALLVDKKGVPWYILKKSVSIPRRPYLLPALLKAGADLQKQLSKDIPAILQGAP